MSNDPYGYGAKSFLSCARNGYLTVGTSAGSQWSFSSSSGGFFNIKCPNTNLCITVAKRAPSLAACNSNDNYQRFSTVQI